MREKIEILQCNFEYGGHCVWIVGPLVKKTGSLGVRFASKRASIDRHANDIGRHMGVPPPGEGVCVGCVRGWVGVGCVMGCVCVCIFRIKLSL